MKKLEKENLFENQVSPELLKTFDPNLLKSNRNKDARFVSGFLMRITKDDSEKLQKLIRERLPNVSLFFIKLYDPDESIFLVSRTDLEDAKVERHRVEIEERSLPK